MKLLITGGLGFIGCNCVRYFAERGDSVFVIDNFARPTSRYNHAWLSENNIPFEFADLDITDWAALYEYFSAHTFDAVIHLAGQVAVTTSLERPRSDFEINAGGTLNLLECLRLTNPAAVFINASTNKVYGSLSSLEIIEDRDCYRFKEPECLGISESQPLDFFSPYGCSKGVADQYTVDYARSYGLNTVTIRQSCIYGPHQFGIEDQGWLAWFIIAALTDTPVTLYGDGKQVRDVLHVDDLLRLYEAIIEDIEPVRGYALNIGGGTENAISLLQLIEKLESLRGKPIPYIFSSSRTADQKIFVSDNSLANRIYQFEPKIGWRKGTEELYHWLETHWDYARQGYQTA